MGNDPHLLLKTTTGEDLKQDMLFNFVKDEKKSPSEWLGIEDQAKYAEWIKKES